MKSLKGLDPILFNSVSETPLSNFKISLRDQRKMTDDTTNWYNLRKIVSYRNTGDVSAGSTLVKALTKNYVLLFITNIPLEVDDIYHVVYRKNDANLACECCPQRRYKDASYH